MKLFSVKQGRKNLNNLRLSFSSHSQILPSLEMELNRIIFWVLK